MRKGYGLAALGVLGAVALAGWVTLGSAQPGDPTDEGKPVGKLSTKVIVEPILAEDAAPDALPRGDDLPGTPLLPVRRSNSAPPADPVVPPLVNDPYELPTRPVPTPGRPVRDPEPAEREDVPLGRPLPVTFPGRPPQTVGEPSAAPAPGGRPSVSLEWDGPSAVKLGTPTEYALNVKNTSTAPVQKLVIQVRVPNGVTVAGSEPKAETEGGVLVWELGALAAGHERRLALKLVAPQRGDVTCQAWVTFTGTASVTMRVRDPKLVVKVRAPEKVLLGDPANVVLTVSNPGDHPAEHVRITAMLPEGLECVRGPKLNFDLGTLGAGENRTLTVPCTARAAGPLKCEISGEADGGLKSGDVVSLSVVQPRLDLAVAGPKLRYLDRRGTYTVKITNPGEVPATNVFVTERVPAGFKFVAADSGGQFDGPTSAVKWFLGELGAGESKEVKFELMAAAPGEFTHSVSVHAARGMKAEQTLKTVVEGLSAILMEVVDVDDPVEVGSETAYEIKVTNTGSKAETDLKLTCTLPPQVKLKAVQGPVKYEVAGNEVIFQSLARLAPRADVVYKVTVTAVQKGDARFKASLTTATLVEPVVKVEPTKVYAE
jgi:uncharacterized repeat protein (TIGR01451 family)